MVDQFWRGVCAKPHAALVTFNGRGFDLPLLELAAFDQGLDISKYWPKRARFKPQYHLDLQEELSNYGASRLYGGLNMLAKRLGLPGKQGVKGDDVAALYEAGRIDRVSGYCICDTLDTYFVFLRFERLCGRIKPSQEEELRRDAVRVARESAQIYPGVSEYLEALPFYPGSSGQPAL
jgi:predicted PolB exonuclease-like 3'-5' exonuclease